MSDTESLLGTGWAFPPTFTRGGADVEMVSGPEDIRQGLRILLSTRLGERVMREDFGCDLSSFLFEEIDQRLIAKVSGIVRDAVLYYEPRIRLIDVDVTEDEPGSGRLMIRLDYAIPSTNSRYNLVFPFYTREPAGEGPPN